VRKQQRNENKRVKIYEKIVKKILPKVLFLEESVPLDFDVILV
jgi:hypothetical protein